ncbi:MAG: hypothetical protein EPN92_13975, partial [Chitinophagaceae bacterium]
MAKAVAAWKAKRKSLKMEFEGQELKNYNEHRNSFFETKVNFPEDQWIVNIIFFSKGWLSFSSNKNISAETFDLLKRFAAVFEQTYIRFNDLKQAEEQAIESQIQLAMERVRARTMAMQRSDELQDAASVMVHQIQTLGVPQFGSGFNIWDDDKKAATAWMCNVTTDNLPPPFKTSSSEDIFLLIHNAAQRGESLFVREQAGEELKAHYRYMNSIPIFKEYVESASPEGLVIPEFQIMHCAFFSQGYLMFITYEAVPEAHDIFKRFAKVFEQTYTRFLDLQKAEAQAREAEIQLALERVRARSLAMHHTSELQEVVNILAQQLLTMGMDISGGVIITINDEVDENIPLWASSGAADYIQKVVVPFLDKPIFTDLRNAIKKKNNFFAGEYSREEKTEFFEHLFLHAPWNSSTEERKKQLLSREGGLTRSAVISQYTSIAVTNHYGKKFSDEDNDILKRFGKIFEQSYTRFLDLQKAEAQARESQIEAALERVRSRSMGMQKSEELREVIQVIYEQLVHLNFKLDGAGFAMDYRESDDFNFWLADPTSAFPYQVHIPYFDHPQFNRYKEAKEKGIDFYTSSLTSEERNGFFDHISKYIPIPQELKKVVYNAPGYETSHVILKNVILYILNFSGLPFSGADNDTLMRFGRVFEQTYTRFNDLKKAEAQAREAKIEAALEKVRSRSLAMHKSDELQEVVNTVFERLQELNVKMDSCNIAIFKEGTRDYDYWIASPVQQRSEVFHVPYMDLHLTKDLVKAREEGADIFFKSYSFEEKNEWFDYAYKLSDFNYLTAERKKFIAEAEGIAFAIAFAKNTGVQINRFSKNLPSEADIDILKRFSKVFEQAYIRF